jgi:hypothetical protein
MGPNACVEDYCLAGVARLLSAHAEAVIEWFAERWELEMDVVAKRMEQLLRKQMPVLNRASEE